MKKNEKESNFNYKSIWEKIKKNKYLMAMIVVGIILLLLPSSLSSSSKSTTQTEQSSAAPEFSLEEQEEKLESILSEIDGAGRVKVMLTLKTSSEQIIATDEDTISESESDGTGIQTKTESSVSTVVISTGRGLESVVILKYIYPEYAGVLIVAEGADSSSVKLMLTKAAASLTGLGTDKITISKMKDS